MLLKEAPNGDQKVSFCQGVPFHLRIQPVLASLFLNFVVRSYFDILDENPLADVIGQGYYVFSPVWDSLRDPHKGRHPECANAAQRMRMDSARVEEPTPRSGTKNGGTRTSRKPHAEDPPLALPHRRLATSTEVRGQRRVFRREHPAKKMSAPRLIVCAVPLRRRPEAGKRREVHGLVDVDEHVGVLRHWLVDRQRAEQGDPSGSWLRLLFLSKECC